MSECLFVTTEKDNFPCVALHRKLQQCHTVHKTLFGAIIATSTVHTFPLLQVRITVGLVDSAILVSCDMSYMRAFAEADRCRDYKLNIQTMNASECKLIHFRS